MIFSWPPFLSAVRPTLLYIISEAVIPARIEYGVNTTGNPVQKYWIPGQARNDNQGKGASDAMH